jgi:NtrC-family two-component system sensor histidine kinase KinB
MTSTLRRKILLGYGIALALVGFVLVWALVSLRALGSASDAILQENYKSALAAENMIDTLERQDSAMLLMLLRDEGDWDAQYVTGEQHFLEWLGRAKDNITIEGEAGVIQAIEEGYKSYLSASSETRLALRRDSAGAARLYHDRALPRFAEVRDSCVRLRELNEEAMGRSSARARSIATRALWSTAVVGAAALVLGLGFSLLLSAALVRPLREIMRAARRVAEGDYDVQLPLPSRDEIGRLAAEFSAMVRKLRGYHDLHLERFAAETQKNAALIRSIDDGIVLVDAEFTVTAINPAACRILSVEEPHAIGRHFLELLKDEELFGWMRQAAEAGRAPALDERQNVLTVEQEGRPRYYQFSIVPVRNQADHMIGVVLLLRDVTKLRELDRLKSDFVLTASHELRTPLTSVGMAVDLLRERAPDRLNEKEKQLLEAAHEDVQRLKALVNDLLDLSRLEAGKVEMQLDDVPVRLLTEKAVGVLRSQAEEKAVEVSLGGADDLPNVRADANKIAWVLTNLLANALRYVQPHGHVRISAERVGGQVHVSVSDDGPGIPPELQARVFDRFVQVGQDKGAQGSGLGLAICKEIVRAHGGTIWVESEPGEGATFTFTLPVAT